MKRIHILRTGRQTPNAGAPIDFAESDLAASAAAYDPALHQAPLVIGHPKHDAPAYGSVAALAADGGDLFATPEQVEPQFAEMVKAGRFNKVSASFYAPDSPANPKPGVYYLRHVGFLGAQPPAIKGLKPIEFAEDEAGTVTIDFAELSPYSVANLFSSLRDWLLAKFGQEDADKALPGYATDALLMDAARPAGESTFSPAFSEEVDTVTQEELAAKEAELKAAREKLDADNLDFAERSAKLAAAEKAAARKSIAEFAEAQVKAGRVLPRDQAGLVEFMAGLDAEDVIEFAEGDGQVKKPAEEWFRGFIEHLPPAVDFSERAGRDKALPADAPADATALARAAVEFQEAEAKNGRVITIAEAVDHVKKAGA